MGQLIRVVILSWSAALLTASYAGMFAKMDPTFIATVFTASAAAVWLSPLTYKITKPPCVRYPNLCCV